MAPSGFTLLELVVVVAIIAFLFAVALERYLYLAERAEAAMVEANIEHMKAGLRLALIARLIRNEPIDSAAFQGDNPIQWLEAPMPGYRGAFFQAEAPSCVGCWFFLRERGTLFYRPRLKYHFQPEDGGDTVRVWVQSPQEIRGAAVNPIETWPRIAVSPYRWFDQERSGP